MGRYELWKDKADEWRFNLLAGNGQVIAVSEGYSSKQAAKNGIKSIRMNALFSRVVEISKDK